MKIKHPYTITLLLIAITTFSTAQNYSVENSVTFIAKGIEYHKAKKYQTAIKEYEKVHRNDTNYALALYESSFSLLMNKKYDKCVEICKKGLYLNSYYNHSFYTNLGTAYSEMKQYDKAISTYKTALRFFPKNSTIKYNLAVALVRNEDYEKGVNQLYDNLRENPYHTKSHYFLGLLCEDQELESQALMAYTMYLILADSDYSLDELKAINGYLSGTMDGKQEYGELAFLNQGYDDIDDLINNKVAIDDKYTTKSKLSLPIIKQADFLINALDEVTEDKGFWNTTYVPLYKKMYEEGHFAGFSYSIVSSAQTVNPKIAKQHLKNISKVQSFYNWFYVNVTKYFNIDDSEKEFHFLENKISAIGNLESESPTGKWTYYYPNGAIARTGQFKNGKKDGEWKSYFSSGVLKNTYNYESDNVNGEFKQFSENGVLLKTGNFENNLYQGIVTLYYTTGGIKEELEYDQGVLNGPLTYYFRNGMKRITGRFEDGKVEGDLIYYGISGNKTRIKPFKNGSVNGTELSYYMDGTISSEKDYEDDILEGKWKTYYQNGQLMLEAHYKEGGITGKSTRFHENGQIDNENTFDQSGKENGTSTRYFENGKVLSIHEYKKGDLVKYKFNSPDGITLSQGYKSGKYLKDYKRYDKNGFLHSSGDYEKGKQVGEWTYYYAGLEIPVSKFVYKKGKLDGTQLSYYSNGNIKKKYKSVGGITEGEYHEFAQSDGKIVTNNGYYKDDEVTGEFVRRNSMNKIVNREYYKEGKNEGWQSYYTQKGQIAEEQYFEDGVLFTSVYFDTLGMVIDSFHMKNGTGNYIENYPNGSKRFSGEYINGTAEGKFTWYYPNGKISFKGQYINGSKHGEWRGYHENGKESKSYIYEYGDLEGESKIYFDDGAIKTECRYKDGQLEGEYTRYFWNGKKRIVSHYKNGDLNGEAKYYVPTGDLAIIRNYVEDILINYSYIGSDNKPVTPIHITGNKQVVTAYFPNGKKSVEYTIENNMYQNTFTWFYPSGEMYRLSHYKEGLLHGEMKAYSPSANPLYMYIYKNDNAHGICKDYHPEGGIKSAQTYFMGDLEGKTTLFDKNGKLYSVRYYFYDRFYGGNF